MIVQGYRQIVTKKKHKLIRLLPCYYGVYAYVVFIHIWILLRSVISVCNVALTLCASSTRFVLLNDRLLLGNEV